MNVRKSFAGAALAGLLLCLLLNTVTAQENLPTEEPAAAATVEIVTEAAPTEALPTDEPVTDVPSTDEPVVTATEAPTDEPSPAATEEPVIEASSVATDESTPEALPATVEVTPVTVEPAPTDEAPPPETLTPVPGLALLPLAYSTGFETGFPPELSDGAGWTAIASGDGHALQSGDGAGAMVYLPATFANVDVQARVLFNSGTAVLVARQSSDGEYRATLASDGIISLFRDDTLLGSGQAALTDGQPATFRLSAVDSTLRVAVDGIQIINIEDVTPLASGSAGFGVEAGAVVRVDDFSLYGVGEATDDVVGAQSYQGDLTWGNTQYRSLSSGTTHEWSFWLDQYYPYLMLDLGKNSGNLRYTAYVSGPTNTSARASIDGRAIIWQGMNAGNYSMQLVPDVGTSGDYNVTIWSCCKPRIDPAWGYQSSYTNIHTWRMYITTAGTYYIRMEVTEGNFGGPWRFYNDSGDTINPGSTYAVGSLSYPVTAVEFYLTPGWYHFHFDPTSNGSYRIGIFSGPALSVPTLTLSGKSANNVTLNWADNSASEEGYRVLRNGVLLGQLSPNTTTFTDSGLLCGTTYNYMLRAHINNLTRDSSTLPVTTAVCHDAIASAIVLNTLPYSITADIWGTTTTTTDPNMACLSVPKNYSNTIWYRYTPTVPLRLRLDTFGSPNDTVLGLYTGNPAALTALACNDDSSGTTSWLSYTVAANVTYYILVANYGTTPASTVTPVTLNITSAPDAPVLSSPANNAIVTTVRPTLVWVAAATANRYRVQLATDSDFLNPVTLPVSESATTSLLMTAPLGQGTYYWQVQARDAANNWGAWSPYRSFTVNLMNAPLNAAKLQSVVPLRPTFSWFAATGASGYWIEVAYDDAFNSTAYLSPLLPATAVSHVIPASSPALSYGTYYWRVIVANIPAVSSVYRSFTVTPPPPPVPVLNSPANAAFINFPWFTWNAVVYNPIYGNVTYSLQVDNNSNFSSPEFQPLPDGDTFDGPLTLPDGLYYWRVMATNDYGLSSAWSVARTVTMDTVPPAAPVISAPANNTITSLTRPTLTMVAVPGANRYRCSLAYDDAFSAPVFTELETPTVSLALTVAVMPVPLEQGQYFARCAARDAAGNWSTDSAVSTFTVNLAVSPADRAALISATTLRPAFTWAAYGLAGSNYLLEIATDVDFINQVYMSPLLTTTTHTIPVSAPALTQGQYFWRIWVNGNPPPPTIYRRFAITPNVPLAPVVTAPVNALITNTPPTPVWNTVVGAVSYEVQLDNVSTFLSIDQASDTAGLSYPVTTLPDSIYYYRVRAINAYGAPGAWSVVRYFTLDTIAPAAPVLSAPIAGATVTTPTPAVSWLAATGAARYVVQFSTVSDFSSATTVNTTAVSAVPPSALLPTTVYWRVQAVDAAGNVSLWSATRTFIVTSLVPVLNRFPTANPVLTWTSVYGAQGYEVQVSQSAAFATILWQTTSIPSTDLAVMVAAALPDGTYYWRVRARTGATTFTAYSAGNAFVVDS